jgi:hypothetical protein
MVKQVWMLIIVLGGSLGLAFAVSSMIDRGPFERSVVGVEAIYWEVAQQVATSPGSARPLPSPLYPHIISPLTSEDLGAVRNARRILTLTSIPLLCLLVWLLARSRVGPGMAILAPISIGLTAPIALSAGTLTPAIPATLLALTALVVLDRSGRLMAWILAGVLIALVGRFHAGLAWGLVVLLLASALLRSDGGPRKRRAGSFGIAFLITLAISGPALDLASFLPRIPGADVYRGHRVEASGVSARRGDADPARWWSYLDFLRVASR